MCGRMTQVTDPAEVARIFDADARIAADDEGASARYNVAPTQPLTVVLQRPDEGRVVEQHRWGLIRRSLSVRRRAPSASMLARRP